MSVFSTLINFVFPENLTEVTTQCTESGLWQQIDFTCLFDPLAVNLKQGTNIFGGKIAHSFLRLKSKKRRQVILLFYSSQKTASTVKQRETLNGGILFNLLQKDTCCDLIPFS
jgi:hypothetical protein